MSEPRTEHTTAPLVEEVPQGRLILVICRNYDLQRLRREFKEWQDAGYHHLASGMTTKRFDGYLLFAWREKPVSRRFMEKLMRDTAIFDYIPITLMASEGQEEQTQ